MPGHLSITPLTTRDVAVSTPVPSLMAAALLTSLNQITSGYIDAKVTKEEKVACLEALKKPEGREGLKEFVELMNSLSPEKRATLIVNKLTEKATLKVMEAIGECMTAIREDEDVSKSVGITTDIATKLHDLLVKELGSNYAARYDPEELLKVVGNDVDNFFADIADSVEGNTDVVSGFEHESEIKGARVESVAEAREQLSAKTATLVQALLESQQVSDETSETTKAKFAFLEENTFKEVLISELVEFAKTAPSKRGALIAKYRNQLDSMDKSFDKTVEKYAVLSDCLKALRDNKLIKKSFPQHTFYNPEEYFNKYFKQLVANTAASELPSRVGFYSEILKEVFDLPASNRNANTSTTPRKLTARHKTYESFLQALQKESGLDNGNTIFSVLSLTPDEILANYFARVVNGDAEVPPTAPELNNIRTVGNLKEEDFTLVALRDGQEKTALGKILRDRLVAHLMSQNGL